MIALALMLAQAAPTSVPPCKSGAADCKPWERAWGKSQEAPGYSNGPFNLIIRWGNSSPVAIRYETRARCETAALMVVVQGDALALEVGEDGKPKAAPELVKGPNAPWAFCIPG